MKNLKLVKDYKTIIGFIIISFILGYCGISIILLLTNLIFSTSIDYISMFKFYLISFSVEIVIILVSLMYFESLIIPSNFHNIQNKNNNE